MGTLVVGGGDVVVLMVSAEEGVKVVLLEPLFLLKLMVSFNLFLAGGPDSSAFNCENEFRMSREERNNVIRRII